MGKTKKTTERVGALIIFFVTVLAIMNILNGINEEKVVNANNQQLSYSDWYGSKSIKQVLKENERDYLESLKKSGLINDEKLPAIQAEIENTKSLILKYEAEKTEILLGSENIPRGYWAQDLDGELGKIVGLKEWQKISNDYSKSVAQVNLGILFLQISILFGVIILVISEADTMLKIFTVLMWASGLLGIAISIYGYVFSV
ncbi:DUF4337 family protein [Pareuzebyella sediminis]|uniref:DUF4337 family protein n=1 Tax=Pareuzebyella sediminis TaxID=2607998 RepID=UPI0011EBE871|nr:DUF4337 family protein [Pareuzebyella sediminis]